MNSEMEWIKQKFNQNGDLTCTETLRELAIHHATLLSALPDIIMEVDISKKYIWANKAGLDFFGDDVIGKDASFYFEGEQNTYEVVDPIFHGSENLIHVRSWQRRRDGQIRLLAWWCRALKDSYGNTLGAISSARDITDKDRNERELRFNEARLRSLVAIQQYQTDSIQELLDYALEESLKLTSSQIGYIYFYNNQTREFTLNTWSRGVMDQCSIQNPHSIYHLEKTGLWGEVVRQQRPIVINNFEMPHPLKKGYPQGHAPIKKFMSIPVFYNNNIIAVVGQGNKEYDYTESDILQLTLLMNSVWRMVEQKSEEIKRNKLEEQLQQAQKLESIGKLAGGIAHDFNNMLSAILGYSELAMESLYTKHPAYQNLIEVHKAAERSAVLTRQLLTFARKQIITPQVLDLNEVVDNMLRMLERLVGEDINIEWKPSFGTSIIKIDPSQIDQILANLCVNARDAIRNHGQIRISTDQIHLPSKDLPECDNYPSGDYIRLMVADNGSGMNSDILMNIFEPFFTTKSTGTGLGLSIVYGIIKQNNGFILVQSHIDKGTTFQIFLPAFVQKIPEKNKHDQEFGRLDHKVILLVEDEITLLNMTALILERKGYTVLKAGSPGQAIYIAQQFKGTIDLLITDVIMPEMDGRTLAKRIIALYPQIKRLFMSGYTEDIIAYKGVIDKDIAFIQKPFSSTTLIEKILEALK